MIETNGCPLNFPFKPLGPLTIPSWYKTFQKGLYRYNFKIKVNYPMMPLLYNGGTLLIDVFISASIIETTL